MWLTTVAATSRVDGWEEYHDLVMPETSAAGHVVRVALSTVVAAGAAVLPDLDEPEATAARSFGVVGRSGSKLVRWCAGGHRQRTHTLLFAGLVSLLGWWAAGIWYPGAPVWQAVPYLLVVGVCAVWGFLLIGRAAEDRGLPARVSTPVAWLMGTFALVVASLSLLPLPDWIWLDNIGEAVSPRWWLPAVLGIGCVAHLLGDVMTKTGVPVFWPLSKQRLKLNLFKVGGVGENWVAAIVVLWTVIAATLVFAG